MVCIICPKGCKITVELQGNEVRQVTGYSCKRGKEYGQAEAVHPVRSVTSTVLVKGGARRLVPVKTERSIPKEKIFDCMEAIRKLKVEAPVQIGQVLLEDIAGTRVALVATGNVDKNRDIRDKS